jgi:putative transposase
MYYDLLAQINSIDKASTKGRKRKLSNETALLWTLYVLMYGCPWNACMQSDVDESTIRKRVKKWMHLGVFSIIKQNMTIDYLRKNPKLHNDLFIDCSFIKNISGKDVVGKNPTDRGRLATKISVICTASGVPIASHYAAGNVPDAKLVESTVCDIPSIFFADRRRKFCLIGDRGYVLKSEIQQELRQKYRIRIVRPRKSNDTKYQLSKNDKRKLRKRNCIERLFCRLDKFQRIKQRHDKGIDSFIAFHDLAFILILWEQYSQCKICSLKKCVQISNKPD